MNNLKKNGAINEFRDQFKKEGFDVTGRAMSAVEKDAGGKKFTEEEITEVLNALQVEVDQDTKDILAKDQQNQIDKGLLGTNGQPPAGSTQPGNDQAPPAAAVNDPNAVIEFEKWKAKIKTKKVYDPIKRQKVAVFAGLVLDGGKKISVHHMEHRHANELNSQAEFSGFIYLEKGTADEEEIYLEPVDND